MQEQTKITLQNLYDKRSKVRNGQRPLDTRRVLLRARNANLCNVDYIATLLYGGIADMAKFYQKAKEADDS